jgi:hypothetical protein
MFLAAGYGKQEERTADCRVWRSAVLWFHFVYYAGTSNLALADFRSKRRKMPFVCLLSVLVEVLIIFCRSGSSSAAPRHRSPDTGYFWRWLGGKERHAFPLLKVNNILEALTTFPPIRPHSVVRKQTALHVVTFRNHLSNIVAHESYYQTDWIMYKCEVPCINHHFLLVVILNAG